MSRAADPPMGTKRLPAAAATRVWVSALLGLATGAVVAFAVPWQVALLAGWDAAMLSFVTWVWLGVARLDARATQQVAMREDPSRAAADGILVLASVVNLVGVTLALIESRDASTAVAGVINVVAVLSVMLSWAAIHTVFALRYAGLYYRQGGGVEFDGGPPDYRDFAYLSFTLGMTYQVSDTALQSKLFRMTVLRHSLLSYLFGVVIVATMINVVAGLFRG